MQSNRELFIDVIKTWIIVISSFVLRICKLNNSGQMIESSIAVPANKIISKNKIWNHKSTADDINDLTCCNSLWLAFGHLFGIAFTIPTPIAHFFISIRPKYYRFHFTSSVKLICKPSTTTQTLWIGSLLKRVRRNIAKRNLKTLEPFENMVGLAYGGLFWNRNFKTVKLENAKYQGWFEAELNK